VKEKGIKRSTKEKWRDETILRREKFSRGRGGCSKRNRAVPCSKGALEESSRSFKPPGGILKRNSNSNEESRTGGKSDRTEKS